MLGLVWTTTLQKERFAPLRYRKNWLFVGSEDGGEAAAVILSLVQTCRGLGVNPREYLEDVMRRLMSHSVNKLNELLPNQWAKSRTKS